MTRFLCLGLMVALQASAFGYVRSRTPHSTPIKWASDYAFLQVDSAGTPDLPADTVFSVVQDSMAAWRGAVASGAYVQLKYDPPQPSEAHYDGTNVLKFRTDKWCHPVDAQDPNSCYDAAAAAITTVFYVDKPGDTHDGEILDADIEMNNINFTFAIVVEGQPLPKARTGTSVADLENTLVHELGHLQGLDHTCADSATPPQSVDNTGKPPTPCGQLLSLPIADRLRIIDATMFNTAIPGEIKKRTPETDDINGIYEAYPIAGDPRVYTRANLNPTGCTLSTSPAAPSLGLLLLVLLASGALVRRRLR